MYLNLIHYVHKTLDKAELRKYEELGLIEITYHNCIELLTENHIYFISKTNTLGEIMDNGDIVKLVNITLQENKKNLNVIYIYKFQYISNDSLSQDNTGQAIAPPSPVAVHAAPE